MAHFFFSFQIIMNLYRDFSMHDILLHAYWVHCETAAQECYTCLFFFFFLGGGHKCMLYLTELVPPLLVLLFTCSRCCRSRDCERVRWWRHVGNASGCFWGWRDALLAPGKRWWRYHSLCAFSSATAQNGETRAIAQTGHVTRCIWT